MNKGTVKCSTHRKATDSSQTKAPEKMYSYIFQESREKDTNLLKKDRTLLSISQKETADFRLLM